MRRLQSTISTAILFSLLAACGATGFGQPYHKASVAAEVDISSVSVTPLYGAEGALAGSQGASSRNALGRRDDRRGLSLAQTETNLLADVELYDSISAGWVNSKWGTTPQEFTASTELVFDLGVGEFPYDDGFEDFRMDYRQVRGFSDALVQLELRTQFEPGVSWHGIAAMNRVQEESLMQTMDQADWAWVGIGLQYSW